MRSQIEVYRNQPRFGWIRRSAGYVGMGIAAIVVFGILLVWAAFLLWCAGKAVSWLYGLIATL